MLSANDHVSNFTLPDQNGEPRQLTELLSNGPVVLFFYPAAMTPGCTKESCHFRDLGAEFAAVGAQRVGISLDAVDRQAEFAGKHGLDFPLLADVDGAVAKQFGVKRPVGFLKVKRATFVIGTDAKVLGAFSSELNMEAHADQALELLRSSSS